VGEVVSVAKDKAKDNPNRGIGKFRKPKFNESGSALVKKDRSTKSDENKDDKK
jgi:hypothetical protein